MEKIIDRTKYIRGKNLGLIDFYQFPRKLLALGIKNPRIIPLYMLMFDRFKLSSRNDQFRDDDDAIFIYFSRKEAEKVLEICNKTAIKLFNFLIQNDIIAEEYDQPKNVRKVYLKLLDDVYSTKENKEFIDNLDKANAKATQLLPQESFEHTQNENLTTINSNVSQALTENIKLKDIEKFHKENKLYYVGDTEKIKFDEEFIQNTTPIELIKNSMLFEPQPYELKEYQKIVDECLIDKDILTTIVAVLLKTKEKLPHTNYIRSVIKDWKKEKIETLESAINKAKFLYYKYGLTEEGQKEMYLNEINQELERKIELRNQKKQQRLDKFKKEWEETREEREKDDEFHDRMLDSIFKRKD